MRPPHTVTLYLLPEDGPWQATVLHGVWLEETQGTSARRDGAVSAGETRLIVPFSVRAEAVGGGGRQYTDPAAYAAAADRTALYTLAPGGGQGLADSFFVRGICTDDAAAARRRTDARRVCRVAVRDRGGRTLRHWTVTAV